MTETPETCYKCGGDVEAEIVGKYRDWVCQECGITVYSGLIVENEQHADVGSDYEVME